jgi:hypothetical protein
MSTIDSKAIILTLLKNNGIYPGDPQVYSVWGYTNNWSNASYAFHRHQAGEDSFLSSPDVNEPILFWSAKDGLTDLGELFIMFNDE